MHHFSRLMLLSISFVTLVSFNVVAADDFTKQVEKISASSDKVTVNSQLRSLLNKPSTKPLQQLEILSIIGANYHSLADFDNAIATYESYLLIAKHNNLITQQADAHKIIGVFNYYKGEYKLALKGYQLALDHYLTTSELIKQADLYNNIGLVYSDLGDVTKSLASYKLAQSIYQIHGDEYDKIDIHYNISGIFLELGRYDAAIEIIKNVIEKRLELQDIKGSWDAKSNLGIAYKDSGQYQLAEQTTLAALNYYIEQADQYSKVSQLNNLSSIYIHMGKFEQANIYIKQCLDLAEKINNIRAYSGCLSEQATYLYSIGKIDESLISLEKANEIIDEINYATLKHSNLALAALLLADQKKPDLAVAKIIKFERDLNKAANDKLNVELALYESEQKAYQIKQLQQEKILQSIKLEKNKTEQYIAMLTVSLILLFVFIFYRRNKELNTKRLLSQQVKERTSELEHTSAKLTDANKVKSQFLANMSHEIRTPLTSIIGQSEAIVKGEITSSNITDEVQIIHANSLHLLQLVNDILDLSKIEANKFELDIEPKDLNLIIKELNNIFQEHAIKKGLTFIITHSLSMPYIINVDSLRLTQILINFCSNAIKFTEQGSVELSITAQQGLLTFKVNDTGIGMNNTQVKQVFDCFTQADSSISRRFGGTGLGLFLCGQLADQMNAEIEVESTSGLGSSFSLILNQVEIDIPKMAEVVAAIEFADETNSHFKGKVLLADDHDDNRRLIARFLSSLGLDVKQASNGKEAVSLCLSYQPDVILLDIQMPEMDGIEVLAKLKQLGCDKPTYALTANAMAHEVKLYLKLGFTGHLQKPVVRQDFIKVMSHHFALNDAEPVLQQRVSNVDLSDLALDFKNSLTAESKSIQASLDNQDFEQLLQQAHRLGGAAGMFGFDKLGKLAIQLELSIKKQNKVDAVKLTQSLLAELSTIQLAK
ncbi:response regulator [Colwelliaceae bacterium BS250]